MHYTTCIDGKNTDFDDTVKSGGDVPSSFKQIANIQDAVQRKKYYDAHYKEGDGLFESGVLKLIPLPPGVKKSDLHRLHTVYKEKTDLAHTAKARTVFPKLRVPLPDTVRTFSPTVKMTTYKRTIAEAADMGYDIIFIDDKQAYAQADWPEGVPKALTTLPEGYCSCINGVEHCCEAGNLYGYPPAGRNWYNTKRKFTLDY